MEKEEEKKKPHFSEGIKGVMRHVRPFKKVFTVLLVLGLISALANGVVPYVTGRFFDSLIHLVNGQATFIQGFPQWQVLLAAWAIVQVVANGIDWIRDRIRRSVDMKVSFSVETTSFAHLLRLPLSYHTNTHIHGEISKINNASWQISAITRTVMDIAPQLLSVVIGITLALTISVPLAGILAAGVLVYILTLIPLLIPIAARDAVARRVWNDSWNDATESIHQISSVKQAAAEEHESSKIYTAFMDKTYTLWMKLELTWSNISFYQRIIVFLTQLAVFIVSVQYVANGTITVGELVALNGYALMFFGPFVALGFSWQTIQNGLTSAAHLEETLKISQEVYRPTLAHQPETHKGEVHFDHVAFSYEEGKGSTLADLNFKTHPGEVIALVGESGAGKSTAISLISGYYFPQKGAVSIDGVSTQEWDLTELRKQVAMVPQEVALFNDSILANIRYGSFEATTEAVENAAKEAHIHDFIMTLPKGYEALVGERGVKLSVGQKQRVAIARAILRDPKILILDEPTSALDSQTEKQLTESLEKLMRGRTTFIIAHRLSTVRKADTILFLKDGTIAEQGSHDELMAIPNGGYRNLYELHVGLHE
ncbi:MAG: transporter related protein [Parcubacteria group bacterium]|nr:transporter related protein [Parcubacteria group bacterium]